MEKWEFFLPQRMLILPPRKIETLLKYEMDDGISLNDDDIFLHH